MSEQAHTAKPTNPVDELPREIFDLVELIQQLPGEARTKIDLVLARVVEGAKRRRRILSLVQDALGQLRVDMKYLAFDLEATRRERDEFRRKWEETL